MGTYIVPIHELPTGRSGKFAEQNIAGSFLSRNTWLQIILIESDRDLRTTCILKEK